MGEGAPHASTRSRGVEFVRRRGDIGRGMRPVPRDVVVVVVEVEGEGVVVVVVAFVGAGIVLLLRSVRVVPVGVVRE